SISPTSRTSPRSTRSWRSTSRSRIRHGRPSGSRSSLAARASRLNASFTLAKRDTATQAQGRARPPEVAESRAKTTLFARDGAGRGRMPRSSASQEQRPITALRGVGAALAERLARLGVSQVQDLLFVLPLRYEDRTTIVRIGALLPGMRAVVEGEIQLAQVAYRRRRQLQCSLSDGSGFLTLRFFHFSASQQLGLARGTRLRCFGEVRRGPQGLEMVHPEYRRVGGAEAAPEETLTPIYPLTEGIPQGRLRALIAQALRELDSAAVRDWVPPQVLEQLDLPSLRDALRYVHRPPREAQLGELAAGRHPAQRRLAFEELLAHQASLRLVKRAAKTDPAWPLEDPEGMVPRLLTSLPFSLTRAQARALAEVEADLRSSVPMVRLIQGDVGCGK